jgi:hypothetical protein
VSDARWLEVHSDIAASVMHFENGVALYQLGGFDIAGLDGYRATMALMHALQSGHTSLEGGLLRILEMLGEERPVGDNWHADLIRRVSMPRPGNRPEILTKELAHAADETRRFRHRAMHNYDSFDVRECAQTIDAARLLSDDLVKAIGAFQRVIDPPQ